MLAQRNPSAAYRRVEFDARVAGATPAELVRLCYEQVITALGGAMLAAQRGDNQAKSHALTRAMSALTALQMGVRGEDAIAQALLHIYTSARRAVLDSVLNFDSATLARIRQDFVEINEGLAQATH